MARRTLVARMGERSYVAQSVGGVGGEGERGSCGGMLNNHHRPRTNDDDGQQEFEQSPTRLGYAWVMNSSAESIMAVVEKDVQCLGLDEPHGGILREWRRSSLMNRHQFGEEKLMRSPGGIQARERSHPGGC